MPQIEYTPATYEVDSKASSSASKICLRSTKEGRPSANFTFEAVRSGLFRTTFTSDEHPLPPRPSVSRPESRASADSDSSHDSDVASSKVQTFHNGDAVAAVDWSGAPVVTVRFDDASEPLYSDLPFRTYCFNGSGVTHYTKYNRHTLHVGLGEKAAPMNLSNRRFAIDATDCFGYDAHRSDPMYKHIPLLINATPRGCVAIFSSSHSRGSWSIGAEMDGLWGHYKVR